MILVLLGTQDKSFHRLLEAVEKQIIKKQITEEVIVQAGYTKYESKYMKIFDFIPREDLNNLMSDASFIITHAGVGSILDGLKQNKKLIVAARQKKYKEHTNDHQLQILEEFAKIGYILPLYDFTKLGQVIKKIDKFKPKQYKSNSKIVEIIEDYIDTITQKEVKK